MRRALLHETVNQEAEAAKSNRGGEVQTFNDLALFTQAVEEAGLTFDFSSVTRLNTNFLESAEKYLVLNVKDYEGEEPNNLLLLTGERAFLYSKNKLPPPEAFRAFEKVYKRPYGRSTVLAFLTLSKVVVSYKGRLDTLLVRLRELEQQFDAKKYREAALDFERLIDRLEDFHDILIKLEGRGIKEVETRHISFDYSVLIADSSGLLDRCRNRIAMLKDIARDHEMQVTTDLNRRIERLNDVVKRLTAVTVILMIPTLVASHFGMNFINMPELRVSWAYPSVVGAQVGLMIGGLILFKKIGWL